VGCALGDLYIRRDSSNARLEFKQGLINERIYDTFLLSLRYIVALLQGFQVRILKRREKATLQFALRLYRLLSLMSFMNSFIRMGVRSYLKPSALFLHPGPLRIGQWTTALSPRADFILTLTLLLARRLTSFALS
jgi:hypothetical protein